ncbi:hypothetical protein [Streptomyces sp. RKCA744]|uniref:hypothetical protein n=1 Tax=Streptomyces sp. RKCA744 TaxID=2959340 RepID=UPI0020A0389C|nr:hypothetical protein [Streptomyces sp. RKCA744]MCO8307126.1 hypothetical protein [Streptomyces sp. RKCA744]
MSENTDGRDGAAGAHRNAGAGKCPSGAESPGSLVIGELNGGAVAAGPRAEAEESGRRIGRPADASALPSPVVTPLPDGIVIGRMTGGAEASGPEARATHRSERFFEATPGLIEALVLLHGEPGELRTEAALAEEEIQATSTVEQGRLRRLASLAAQAAGSVGGQTAAGVAAQTITGMLA